jgi:nitroreductase/NAD-dependent dihydropyrimidine dehydrogenase PreA subunit
MNFKYFGKAHYPPATFPRYSSDPDKCKRCGRCVKTCPTHIIFMPEEGAPRIKGYRGLEVACLGCRNCQAVCPERAVTVSGSYYVSDGRYRTIHKGSVDLPNPFKDLESPPFEEIEEKLTETERVIYKRRSNRLFEKKDVPQNLIHRVLEAARYAPTGANDRAWEFVVIQDQALIRRIEEHCLKRLKMAADRYFRPENKTMKVLLNLISLWRPGESDIRVASGAYTWASKDTLYHGAPVVIVVLADIRGTAPILDAGICAQNLVLAAHSLGLGTCYVGFILALYSRPKKELLREIGAVYPMRIATSIALGWPEGVIDRAVPRERPRVVWK